MTAETLPAVVVGTSATGAVAVVRADSRALAGTLDEKMRAFDQIAANLAMIALNGWNTVQKCKAACWLADASGQHPATFINNNWCLEIKGRLMVEPKMEYILGTIQSRVPRFKFEVLREDDKGAKVRMSDSVNTHEVEYTLEDAKRQGLLGRDGNAWTTGNTREMCLKQAVKRCGKRLAAAALMDMPMFEAMDEVPQEAPKDVAKALDEALGGKGDGARGLTKPADAPQPPAEDSRAMLARVIKEKFRLKTKPEILQRATLVYNQMVEDATGVNPGQTFGRLDEIGPIDAAKMILHLDGRKAGAATEADTPPAREAEGGTEPAPADEVPEPQEAVEDAAQPGYDEFRALVLRARKAFNQGKSSEDVPRVFLKEAPKGSGKWWYVDQATFSTLGYENSVKVAEGTAPVLEPAALAALYGALEKACDEKERGR